MYLAIYHIFSWICGFSFSLFTPLMYVGDWNWNSVANWLENACNAFPACELKTHYQFSGQMQLMICCFWGSCGQFDLLRNLLMWGTFQEWYASEVEKKLAAGCQTKNINVNLEILSMWDKTSRFLLNFFIYINNDFSIVLGGWQKCGIANAPENVVNRTIAIHASSLLIVVSLGMSLIRPSSWRSCVI